MILIPLQEGWQKNISAKNAKTVGKGFNMTDIGSLLFSFMVGFCGWLTICNVVFMPYGQITYNKLQIKGHDGILLFSYNHFP